MLNQTLALDAWHQAAGARMVPFAGWSMPVQYTSILAEHRHTRTIASIFDCSHMGQFRCRGTGIAAELDRLLPRRATDQRPGTCRYNFLLADDGTVIDDIIVYRVADDEFYIVVNAGTIAGDAAHISARLSAGATFVDESAYTAKFDVQGPASTELMRAAGIEAVNGLRYFNFTHVEIAGAPCLLSRTGYTGERGYEIYVPTGAAAAVWELLTAIPEVQPAGLGARDTLRLEMGYPLYGHELNRDSTPLDAGFGGLIDPDHEFVGRKALLERSRKYLTAVRFESRRAAREGSAVADASGQLIGTVTSGAFSPSLECAIALAYISGGQLPPGTPVSAQTGRAEIAGKIVALPFYDAGTARGK
jgi:aminomethyltransferase